MNFREELSKRYLVLDGSMGALLQNRGLPNGMAPDVWMMDNSDIIRGAHKEYADAGADILLTNTFGASKWRLAEYNAYSRIREINAKAVEIARQAAGGRCFVAGDIGPSGETIYPTGTRSFEEAYDIFYEQAKILVELGVDLIAIETMFDSLEIRVALSAVRAASSKIPVLAFGTFNKDAITDTGATPENVVAIAEGFHAQGVGVNCSTGPEPMVEVVRRMAAVSRIPVCVQPNAGLPIIKDGRTAFPMKAEEIALYADKFVEAGARIIGGCCGTTPDYIRMVKEKIKGLPLKEPQRGKNQGGARTIVSSLAGHARFGGNFPFMSIGERMNPSGRKKLSESLKKGTLEVLFEDAKLQVDNGAKIMDLNVGVPMVDELELMKKAVVGVQNKYPQIPLMIDSSNSFALDKGASVYYGRPLMNSINAEEEKIHEALPIMKKHGGAVIAMLTGVDVPVTAEERFKNAQKLVKILIEENGFIEEDLVFDCLGLVVSAMHEGSKATLKTISLVKEYFPKAATTLGLSNVSFGLPNRPFVHNAFLGCAVQVGLDTAIMSVSDPMGKAFAAASQMWSNKPGTIEHFINNFAEKIELGPVGGSIPPGTGSPQTSARGESGGGINDSASVSKNLEPAWVAKTTPLEQEIFRAIVSGDKDAAVKFTTEFASHRPEEAMPLFINVMTPAIRHLGDLFAKRVKFIPHLIAAAESMKSAVAVLEPLLNKARAATNQNRGCVVFATVKGDIHDIGKNICVLMLRNFGYEVIDLGRNVDADLIIKTAIEKKAQVVALSALMTTTMMQMKVVIDAVREKKLSCKVVIGGAVVTPDFARDIQADGFSTDVGTVVSEFEKVLAVLKATGL